MNRYVVVSEYRWPGEPIDLPPSAVGVGVQPTDQSNLLHITYLNPVFPITVGSTVDELVNVDKQ